MGAWHDIVQKYNDPAAWLTAEGRVFYASDSADDQLVTGQTSFAATTPTFLLDVPSGVTAIPLMARLFQAGTVAGGAVSVAIEIDDAARYASGGTSETVLCARTTPVVDQHLCKLYSGATAASGYGVRIAGYLLGQDVSPAEGAVNEILWTPTAGLDLLVGPAAFLVFTWAGTTGATWDWSVKWAEIPSDWIA